MTVAAEQVGVAVVVAVGEAPGAFAADQPADVLLVGGGSVAAAVRAIEGRCEAVVVARTISEAMAPRVTGPSGA